MLFWFRAAAITLATILGARRYSLSYKNIEISFFMCSTCCNIRCEEDDCRPGVDAWIPAVHELGVVVHVGAHRSRSSYGLLPVAESLKPNNITLAGSKLVRSRSQTSSKLVGNQLRTSFEPASKQLA